jgi:hypothetical protein
MYHDRPTFSLVKWSEEDVNEYRGGLETKEGVHAVSPHASFKLILPSFHLTKQYKPPKSHHVQPCHLLTAVYYPSLQPSHSSLE